jgi:hypothetical protein
MSKSPATAGTQKMNGVMCSLSRRTRTFETHPPETIVSVVSLLDGYRHSGRSVWRRLLRNFRAKKVFLRQIFSLAVGKGL